MRSMKGGDKLQAKLEELALKLGKGDVLRVGFLESAKYPDGTNVAQVAYWNEYGTVTAPARPFFRGMVERKKSNWGQALGMNLKATGYNVGVSLGRMGEGIKDQLVQSIVETTEPALSPITVMLRGMRRNDPSLVVAGATVGEAAQRVADGKTNYGASTKPLIDSGDMQRSVGYEVEKSE